MAKILTQKFFNRPADIVARDLIGKIIVHRIGKKIFRARIVEDEAYFDENDPASWARLGRRKDNFAMWLCAGTILIKNVHKHLMLNFVTGPAGKAEAVLIRALEPLNFEGRCSGPGLLTKEIHIERKLNGSSLSELKNFWVEDAPGKFNVIRSSRVGVKKDLNIPLRFYINGNENVSRKRRTH